MVPSAFGRPLSGPGLSVAVAYGSPGDAAGARRVADRLGVRCLEPGEPRPAELCLWMEGGVLSLRDHRGRRLRPLSIDFTVPASASRKQPLGRAVGRKTRSVVDATAGWGEDARRLRAMGYALTLVERHPLMAALLGNAAGRAAAAGPPLEVVEADAIDYLRAWPRRWDCVYLDPMFPPKRRASTLARRPLRLLRELAGADADRERLFQAATTAAARRVVVKRPDHGAPAFGAPAQTVAGKLVHYDVYFT